MSKLDQQANIVERQWTARFGESPGLRTDPALMQRILDSALMQRLLESEDAAPRTREAEATPVQNR